MNFLTATKDEQVAEIFRRAADKGTPRIISEREVVEMYGNKQNWEHQQLADGSHGWVWRGPVICAYEAARWALEI